MSNSIAPCSHERMCFDSSSIITLHCSGCLGKILSAFRPMVHEKQFKELQGLCKGGKLDEAAIRVIDGYVLRAIEPGVAEEIDGLRVDISCKGQEIDCPSAQLSAQDEFVVAVAMAYRLPLVTDDRRMRETCVGLRHKTLSIYELFPIIDRQKILDLPEITKAIQQMETSPFCPENYASLRRSVGLPPQGRGRRL